MANQHEEHDLAAYALGALEDPERAGIEAHLRGCSECASELRDYRAVLEALPQTLATEPAPRGAWDAIATRIRGHQPGAARRRRPGLPAFGQLLQPALLGLLVLAVAGLAAWNGLLHHRLSGDDDTDGSGRITVYLSATTADAEAHGQLRMTADQQLGGLVVRDLPAVSADSAYEVWFVRPDQSRVSGGTFRVDALGQAIVEVTVPQPVEQFDGVGISQEPATGSISPTTGDILAGIIYSE